MTADSRVFENVTFENAPEPVRAWLRDNARIVLLPDGDAEITMTARDDLTPPEVKAWLTSWVTSRRNTVS